MCLTSPEASCCRGSARLPTLTPSSNAPVTALTTLGQRQLPPLSPTRPFVSLPMTQGTAIRAPGREKGQFCLSGRGDLNSRPSVPSSQGSVRSIRLDRTCPRNRVRRVRPSPSGSLRFVQQVVQRERRPGGPIRRSRRRLPECRRWSLNAP